jgi:hypothetical protein
MDRQITRDALKEVRRIKRHPMLKVPHVASDSEGEPTGSFGRDSITRQNDTSPDSSTTTLPKIDEKKEPVGWRKIHPATFKQISSHTLQEQWMYNKSR